MADALELEFSNSVAKDQLAALTKDLKTISGVKNAGVSDTRSIDPSLLTAWVTLAGAIVPVLSAIIEMVREKEMKGVKIKVGNQSIEADTASATDIERIAKALGKKK
jgi:hypothetical protein